MEGGQLYDKIKNKYNNLEQQINSLQCAVNDLSQFINTHFKNVHINSTCLENSSANYGQSANRSLSED